MSVVRSQRPCLVPKSMEPSCIEPDPALASFACPLLPRFSQSYSLVRSRERRQPTSFNQHRRSKRRRFRPLARRADGSLAIKRQSGDPDLPPPPSSSKQERSSSSRRERAIGMRSSSRQEPQPEVAAPVTSWRPKSRSSQAPRHLRGAGHRQGRGRRWSAGAPEAQRLLSRSVDSVSSAIKPSTPAKVSKRF
jgi:hypothetical protein